MRKDIFNRIITLFLLVTIMVPMSLQFLHSFEKHTYKKQQTEGLENIQNVQKSCALYHQTINHNAIGLQFDFDINFLQIVNQEVQKIFVESYQCFFIQKSSRAPPISFV